MTKAFNSTLNEGRQPQYLWVYMGKEFYYKHLKELLDKKSVKCTQLKMEKNSLLLKDGTEQ